MHIPNVIKIDKPTERICCLLYGSKIIENMIEFSLEHN